MEIWPGPVAHITVPMGPCLQLALYTQRHLAGCGSYRPVASKSQCVHGSPEVLADAEVIPG